MSMKDRVAIITGASRGIGRATARLFAQAGARVVVFSRSAVQLEEVAGEIAAAGERGRPTGVVREQAVELRGKGRIILRVEERRFELFERGHEDFGDVAAAEPAEAAVQAHARNACRDCGLRASNNAPIFSGDLRPGRSSTAEPTSIA